MRADGEAVLAGKTELWVIAPPVPFTGLSCHGLEAARIVRIGDFHGSPWEESGGGLKAEAPGGPGAGVVAAHEFSIFGR